MPHRVQLKAVNLALASALALGVAGIVGAQQDPNNGGPVLPGPSLDDAPAPAPSVAPPTTAAPSPAPTSTAQPAPQPAPATSPAPVSQPAAAPQPAPAPRAAPVVEQPVDENAPWYERAWGSVTGWFSGMGEKLSAPRASQPAPAAAPADAPADGSARPREGFAADSPERTVRTGMGKCLKTGTWTPEHGGAECPGDTAADAKTAAAPAPVQQAAAPAPAPAPVEVKPLEQTAEKDAKPLEPEVAPTPVAPEPPPAPAKPEVMTLAADALFALGQADLKPGARTGLDELAARLSEVDYQSIRITGHTDPTGAAAANERLSVRRAEAVKRYLVSKGVPADKIATEGMGSRNPVVSQKDCAGLPKAKKAACYQPDRRVEIEVSGATQRAAAK